MKIWLPKRWSRAKRKRRRAVIHWMNTVVSPALKKCLDSVWGDAITIKPFDWRTALNPYPGAQSRFLDDEESTP